MLHKAGIASEFDQLDENPIGIDGTGKTVALFRNDQVLAWADRSRASRLPELAIPLVDQPREAVLLDVVIAQDRLRRFPGRNSHRADDAADGVAALGALPQGLVRHALPHLEPSPAVLARLGGIYGDVIIRRHPSISLTTSYHVSEGEATREISKKS